MTENKLAYDINNNIDASPIVSKESTSVIGQEDIEDPSLYCQIEDHLDPIFEAQPGGVTYRKGRRKNKSPKKYKKKKRTVKKKTLKKTKKRKGKPKRKSKSTTLALRSGFIIHPTYKKLALKDVYPHIAKTNIVSAVEKYIRKSKRKR